jgi:hypothetical protein
MVSKRKLLLINVVFLLVITSCGGLLPFVTKPPNDNSETSSVLTLESQNTANAIQRFDDCVLANDSGLPVNDEIKNTHILYGGLQLDQSGQIWELDTRGVSKLVLDKLTLTTFGYGLGFLKDGANFLMISSQKILLSDLNGHLPLEVNASDVLDEVPATSPIWPTINGNLNPSFTGKRFSFDNNKYTLWKLGDPALILVDVKTGRERKILDYDKQGYIDGAWSPDGKHYAITRTQISQGKVSQVFIMDSDGGNFRELAKFEAMDLGHPYWSPDSSKIIFSMRDDLQFAPYSYVVLTVSSADTSIYKINVRAGSSIMTDSDVIWSPDSKWIAFYTQYERQFVDMTKNISFYPHDLRAMNVNTGQVYCLTQDKDLLDIIFMDWR